jgi:hypothetical protein
MVFMMNDVSFEDMIKLLSFAKGVDLATFDDRGMKTLRQLHGQIRGKDVKALIVPSDAASDLREFVGRLLLVRMSVKVLITAEGYQLLETKRVYKKGTEMIELDNLKSHSVSESRKIGESTVRAAARGLWEEFRLLIGQGRFKALSDGDEVLPVRESTAYPGILVQEVIQRFSLELPRRPWKRGKVFRDDGAKIHTKWFQLDKKK